MPDRTCHILSQHIRLLLNTFSQELFFHNGLKYITSPYLFASTKKVKLLNDLGDANQWRRISTVLSCFLAYEIVK